MPRSKEVRITHPDLGDGEPAVVLEESVPAYERNGWTVVEDGVSERGVEQPVVEPVEQQRETRRTTTRDPRADENKE